MGSLLARRIGAGATAVALGGLGRAPYTGINRFRFQGTLSTRRTGYPWRSPTGGYPSSAVGSTPTPDDEVLRPLTMIANHTSAVPHEDSHGPHVVPAGAPLWGGSASATIASVGVAGSGSGRPAPSVRGSGGVGLLRVKGIAHALSSQTAPSWAPRESRRAEQRHLRNIRVGGVPAALRCKGSASYGKPRFRLLSDANWLATV